jgi:hypothetical protein
MTARPELALRPPRWIGHCHRCRREDREVQTRYEHGARTLCDDCHARTTPPVTGGLHPTLPGVELAPGGPRCWSCASDNVAWKPERDAWLCSEHAA